MMVRIPGIVLVWFIQYKVMCPREKLATTSGSHLIDLTFCGSWRLFHSLLVNPTPGHKDLSASDPLIWPWHVKAKGKQSMARYEAYKRMQDALLAQGTFNLFLNEHGPWWKLVGRLFNLKTPYNDIFREPVISYRSHEWDKFWKAFKLPFQSWPNWPGQSAHAWKLMIFIRTCFLLISHGKVL